MSFVVTSGDNRLGRTSLDFSIHFYGVRKRPASSVKVTVLINFLFSKRNSFPTSRVFPGSLVTRLSFKSFPRFLVTRP